MTHTPFVSNPCPATAIVFVSQNLFYGQLPQGAAFILHLMLGVQRDHAFARLPHIAEQELQKITFTLPCVAEDQRAGVGLVGGTAVKVHDNVGAEAVTANEEALGIGFAGIVHGVQIGNAPGR